MVALSFTSDFSSREKTWREVIDRKGSRAGKEKRLVGVREVRRVRGLESAQDQKEVAS